MFKFLKRTKPIILGRWGVTYEQRVLDKRINWANHDHCGSELCNKSQTKNQTKSKIKNKVLQKYGILNEEDMVPYIL